MANLRQVKQKHACNKIQQARKILDMNHCEKDDGRKGLSGLSATQHIQQVGRGFSRRQEGNVMKKSLFAALGLAVALAFSAPMVGSADAATVVVKHHHHHVVHHHHVRHHRHHVVRHHHHVVRHHHKHIVKKG